MIGHGYGLVKNYRIILGKLNSIVKVLGKIVDVKLSTILMDIIS
ncbi:hypothetical protein [Klebsiella pneumoniae IS43]|uniref:Uncharacterized protein n=1 Tax=Klebsiella pneumoniae IS43 TaxID=1432552 RepID=W1DRH5_KLEPN|nr:hypothetical protein [Klebsiella pneumoniae IS43]